MLFRRIRFWLMSMVLASAFVVVVPPISVAAASPVTVRVTVEEVRALECFEGTAFGACLGSADFYAYVGLGSDPEITGTHRRRQ